MRNGEEIFLLLSEGTKIPIYFFDHGVELLSSMFCKDLKAGLSNAS